MGSCTAGPYAHVRNPIYLGSVIMGIGMVLLIARFDQRAAYGECRLGVILAVILGVFRTIVALRDAK